ncbi:MAG: hypothetical protein KIT00_09105 [Rhodospirillales bacterium]|nr:hypothetical protein [Rhodospirillales bacterium]
MRRAILMGFVALLSSFEAAALSPGLEHRTSTGIAGVVTLAGSPSQRTGKNIPDNLPPPPGGGSSPFSNRNPVQQQQLPQPWAAIPEFIMRDSKACLGMLKGNWAQYLQNDRNWREFDKCLLVESQYKTGRMPNLFNGKVEVWGRASYSYNCYGYAAKPEHPEGWVGPKFNHQGQIVQGHIPIPPDRPQALLEYFTKRHGWKPMALDLSSPPPMGEERVVLFRNQYGGYEHAAIWTYKGVFAKMGVFGVFRFDSPYQMDGKAYGEPARMYRRKAQTWPISTPHP